MKRALASLVIALAACGGSKPSTTPSSTAGAMSASLLTITELSFYDGDEVGAKLHADGKFESKSTHSEGGKPATETWREAFQLTADGKVIREGKTVGELKTDGTFQTTDGKVAPFKIEGVVLVAGDKQISLDGKGMLIGGNPDYPKPMRVEGATDDGSKRAALLILALMMGSGAPASSANTSVEATTP